MIDASYAILDSMPEPVSAPTPSSLRDRVAERLQQSLLGPVVRRIVSIGRMPLWVLRGRPAPAPPHIKQGIVVDVVKNSGAAYFVETGTYRGDTLSRVRPHVARAVSVELDPTLARLAEARFRRGQNVVIHQGDSAQLMSSIVGELTERAVFWLDGHYSGGVTADSGECPVLHELQSVLVDERSHTVLIDDARLFDGTDGYPTIEQVTDLASRLRPEYSVRIDQDIIRLLPSHPAT
jgi:hypothetical protein